MISLKEDGGYATASEVQTAIKPLRRKDIFWAIFGALWAFGITYGIVVALIYHG